MVTGMLGVRESEKRWDAQSELSFWEGGTLHELDRKGVVGDGGFSASHGGVPGWQWGEDAHEAAGTCMALLAPGCFLLQLQMLPHTLVFFPRAQTLWGMGPRSVHPCLFQNLWHVADTSRSIKKCEERGSRFTLILPVFFLGCVLYFPTDNPPFLQFPPAKGHCVPNHISVYLTPSPSRSLAILSWWKFSSFLYVLGVIVFSFQPLKPLIWSLFATCDLSFYTWFVF